MFRLARDTSAGQAAVELVALLPLIVAVLAGVVQAALAAHTVWAAEQAAHAAARAAAVGADSREAALRALPAHLEPGLRVRPRDEGQVQLRLRVPSVLPALDPGSVTARGRFEPQS